ncbi:MAG: SMP-30/gluconolactonase/LRE family protein [Dehalococcoidia bacterium]|nr:SMP-30/gluconolactonase/LRE family protein [Dehalococcoidia bacterium]MSQ34582.1 SMP-30/gluconolactonase/LRE family protein [Dehalococcoidia bacterium]
MPEGYVVNDKRFEKFIVPGEKLKKLWTGAVWAEGPVYFADGDYVLWSDIPNDRLMRWSAKDGAKVFMKPCGYMNGHTLDREGRLVSCEHGNRRVSRMEKDGSVITLVDRYKGKRLNSPNDAVVKSDGTVWFTDPPYGILSDREGHKSDSELGKNYVFRLDPRSGDLRIVADDFDKPNGLAFSPDEKRLYIADTGASHTKDGPHHIRVFDVANGEKLSGGRMFADINPGFADGLRVDSDGNVWTSAGDGIHVFTPQSELIGKVLVPEPQANLVFGGPKKDTLYITATTSLYTIRVNARGDQKP